METHRDDFVSTSLLRRACNIFPFVRVLSIRGVSMSCMASCHLTSRRSGRVRDKVPSPDAGVRAAQLNR